MLRNGKNICFLESEEQKLEEKYNELIKKYQVNPDTLLEDYDEIIKTSIVGIIAYFKATTALRNDLIPNIDILIRNRQFIINQYCNNSSSDN